MTMPIPSSRTGISQTDAEYKCRLGILKASDESGVRVGDNLQNRTAALSQRRDDSVLAGIPHEDVVQADRQGTSCQPATHRIRPDPAARDEGCLLYTSPSPRD